MDFSNYKADSKLGLPANRTSNVRISNPGADALAREQAKTGVIALQGIDRLRAEVQTGRVMQANNEYNKEMMDLTNELRQNKEQDALNTVEQFDEREQKIRSRIQKKYGSYLYGEAGRKYNDMLTRDYNTRRQSMINYQIGEAEKFNDTQYANQLLATQQDMLMTGDDASIDEALSRGMYLAGNRFAHYGQERIQMESQKMAATMVGTALSKAMAEENYGRVDEIRNKYAHYLNPEQSLSAMRLSHKMAEQNEEILLGQAAYQACGNDPVKLRQFIMDNYANSNANMDEGHRFYSQTKGSPYRLGAAEFGTAGFDGHFDCGAWTKAYAQKVGLGGLITDRTADGQWEIMKSKGRAFRDKSKLRDGDFVFWTHTGGEEGSDGVAHVGIYNGKTGKVMQSGNHGVAEIDVDTYDVVGFGRGAGGAARTPAEIENMTNKIIAYAQKQEGLKKSYISNRLHEARLKIQDLLNHDVTDTAQYQSIANQYMFNSDGTVNDELRISLEELVKKTDKGIQKSLAKGSSGSSGSDVVDERTFKAMLMNGDFNSEEEATEYILQGGFGKSTVRKMFAMLDDSIEHKKDFDVDWKGIKQEVKNAVKVDGNTFDYVYENAKTATYDDIDNYRMEHNGRNPSVAELRRMMEKNMTRDVTVVTPGSIMDSKDKFSVADFRSYGLQLKYVLPDGRKAVSIPGHIGTFTVTDEQINRIRDGEDPQAVVLGR